MALTLDEYRNALGNYVQSPAFLELDDTTKQTNLDLFRKNYITDAPDVDVDAVNSITQNENINFLRNTGRGRAIPSQFIQENNIIFPNQEPGYDALTQTQKAEKLEEFKAKIPEMARANPTQQDDTEYFLKESVTQLQRRNDGSDSGRVGSAMSAIGEGFVAGLAEGVGATETADAVRAFFTENPEHDDEFTQKLAQGLGSAGASVAIIAGLALTTKGLGGSAALANTVGTAGSLASNGVMRYNEGYQNAIKAGLDADQASEAGFAATPAAVIDVMSDKILASKLMPKEVNKILSSGSTVEKRMMLSNLVKESSTRGRLMQYSKSALTEGLSEMMGDYAAAYGPYKISGDDQFLPDSSQSLDSFLIGAVLGGGINAGMDTPSMLGNKAGKATLEDGTKGPEQKFSNTEVRDLSIAQQNLELVQPEKQQSVYDLLAGGQYQKAMQLSTTLLESKADEDTKLKEQERVMLEAKLKEEQEAAPATTEEVPVEKNNFIFDPAVASSTYSDLTSTIFTASKVFDESVTPGELTKVISETNERLNTTAPARAELHTALDTLGSTTKIDATKGQAAKTLIDTVAARWLSADPARNLNDFYSRVKVNSEEDLRKMEKTMERFVTRNADNAITGVTQTLDGTTSVNLSPEADMDALLDGMMGTFRATGIMEDILTPEEMGELKNTLGVEGDFTPENDAQLAKQFSQWLQANKDDNPLFRKLKGWVQDLYQGLRALIPWQQNSKLDTTFENLFQVTLSPAEFAQAASRAMPSEVVAPEESTSETVLAASEAAEAAIAELEQKYGSIENIFTNIDQSIPMKNMGTAEVYFEKLKEVTPVAQHGAINRMLADIQLKNPNLQFVLMNDAEMATMGKNSAAFYWPSSNAIYLNTESVRVVSHEVAHALTVYEIDQFVSDRTEATYRERLDAASFDPATPAHIRSLIDVYYHSAKQLGHYELIGTTNPNGGPVDNLTTGQYSFINLKEFVAEAMSSQSFQEQLANIPYKGSTVWQSIVDAISNSLSWIRGIAAPELVLRSHGENALTATLAATRQLIAPNVENNIISFGSDMNFFPNSGLEIPAAGRFQQDALAKAARPAFKSREVLVSLPIEEFLSLADPIIGQERSEAREFISRGELIREIPFLMIDDGKGATSKVIGHEGRHRALALRDLGYTHMPVMIRSSKIRWSEQFSPAAFDFVPQNEWPRNLTNQDGSKTIGYPWGREVYGQFQKNNIISGNTGNLNFLPGASFRSGNDLRNVLAGEKKGGLKSLQASQDGTLSWQSLKAKLAASYRAEEVAMVTDVLEPMVISGRIPLREAVEAVDALAGASVNVVRLNAAEQVDPLKDESGEVQHRLDTLWPGWNRRETIHDAWPSEEARLAYERYSEIEQIMNDRPDDQRFESQSASARYTMVNPKPLDQMADARDITIEEPHVPLEAGVPISYEQLKTRKNGIKFQESTHFPTRKNVIGFGRMYDEVLPSGEPVTFLFEAQSDWASLAAREGVKLTAEKLKETEQKSGDLFEEIEGKLNTRGLSFSNRLSELEDSVSDDKDLVSKIKEYRSLGRLILSNARGAEPNPLLSVYESLVLKATIHDALAKGQRFVAITDAETAMMTEQHDRYVVKQYKSGVQTDPKTAGYLVWKNNAMHTTTGRYEFLPMENNYGKQKIRYEISDGSWDTRDFDETTTQRKGEDDPYQPISKIYKGEIVSIISQEGGMRAAYDTGNGRLHNLMRKLTGYKGEAVSFGEHQNIDLLALNQNGVMTIVGDKLNSDGGPYTVTNTYTNEVRVFEEYNPAIEWLESHYSTNIRGSKVFKNPDGTPKSSITALVYPLDKIDTQEISNLFPGGSAPSSKNNINFLPAQTRTKKLAQGYKRLHEIQKGNLNDKYDGNTQEIVNLVTGLRNSDIMSLPNALQDHLFFLVDNIYEARKNAIPNPQLRIDSQEMIERLTMVRKAVDASLVSTALQNFDGVIDFDGLKIDITDPKAVKRAINEYAKVNNTEDFVARQTKKTKAKARLDKVDQTWRDKFNEGRELARERFANAENYVDEIEASKGTPFNSPELKVFLGMHYDYLDQVDVSAKKGKELFSHLYAINNLNDGTYGGFDLTIQHLANLRDEQQGVSQMAGMFHDPVVSKSKMLQQLDKWSQMSELHQVQLQRVSSYDGIRKFVQEQLMGNLYDGIMRTSNNQQLAYEEEYVAYRNEILGTEELSTEDTVSMAIFGRLSQFKVGENPDQALLRNIELERTSINNIISHGSVENQRLYKTRVRPFFEKSIEGLETYGNGVMEHFMESFDNRIRGEADLQTGIARRKILNKIQEIFSRYTPISEMISEGFFHQPFEAQAFYIPNNVLNTKTTPETNWELNQQLSVLDEPDRQQGMRTKGSNIHERNNLLGKYDFYAPNIEYTFRRNIQRMSVDGSTVSERFILHDRIKPGSQLNNIISRDGTENKQERVQHIKNLAVNLVRNATSSGEPLSDGVKLLRTMVGMYAKPTLSSIHHIVTQPLSAMVDYGMRNGNFTGWFEAARYYASNSDKVNTWLQNNYRWTSDRMALEAQGLKQTRSLQDDAAMKIKNTPFVKRLSKVYEKAGDVMTFFIRHGDDFSVKVTVLAEYARLLREKGYPLSSIEDIDFGTVEGNIMTQATLNAEKNINTSNKILRGELFSDRRTSTTTIRNLLFAFSAHQGSLATQMNQAVRDLHLLKGLGASQEEMASKMRTISAIAMQQFTFTTARFMIGGLSASLMVGLISDLYDDEEGKIADLQERVYIAQKKGDPVKVAKAEHELANAKTVRKVINKINQQQGANSLFKQIIRDTTGAFHLIMGNGVAQQALFMVPDPWFAAIAQSSNEAIVNDFKDRIKNAKDHGRLKEAAKLAEQSLVLENAEYIPLAYASNIGFGMGGIYGSVADSYYTHVTEANAAAMGAKEWGWNDFAMAGITLGLGQSEMTKTMKKFDTIEDEIWKRDKEFVNVKLPEAEQRKRDKRPSFR